MSQSLKIVFFGNERLSSGYVPQGAPTLEALIKNGYNIAAIVVNFELGRSRKPRQLEIEEIAKAHSIPILIPRKLIEIKTELTAINADLGVLVAYGKIIPQEIINIFPHGILNIHPSLLPKYRGPTPIEQAILDGVSQTGVSLMQLVKQMDAGPVFAQTKIELNGHESKQQITSTLAKLGANLLIQNLPEIISKRLKPKPQDESMATYCKLLTKEDGKLNLNKKAITLYREIRAFKRWPKSRLNIYGVEITIEDARIASNAQDGDLILTCGQHTYLEILSLKAPSGKTISGAEFLRGYKK